MSVKVFAARAIKNMDKVWEEISLDKEYMDNPRFLAGVNHAYIKFSNVIGQTLKEYQPKELGKRIKKARKKMGMTQIELSEALHVSQTTISFYEAGAVDDIPDDIYNKMCLILGEEL